jgi:hypothetical protein
MEIPKVFISYSHDSPEHAERVLALSDKLRQDGIDCHIDQYEISPPEGWPRWMINHIEWADFVLVVCTEIYNLRFRGKSPLGHGKGVKWEGAILTQELYETEFYNTRFIPVVFSSQNTDHIPVILKGQTYYDVSTDKGYESLYRHLTKQPETVKPELGKIRSMPPRKRKTDFFSIDATSLRRAYFNRVLEDSQSLYLSGIDRKAVGCDDESCLSLESVYTALLTRSVEKEREFRQEKRDMEEGHLSALTLLDRHDRLVLLGDPGSGKSTFVNFVAICLSGENLNQSGAYLERLTCPLPDGEGKDREEKQPWSHGALLPVRIVLRDFAARGLPGSLKETTAEDLWQFIESELSKGMLRDFAPHLRQELMEKGGIILFDGLDEVPEADNRREQIKSAVEDFAKTFDQCRILVTSRTYAYQKQNWRLSGFSEAELAPFSAGQIRRFIDQWYSHIASFHRYDKEDAQGRAELLKRAVFGSGRLLELAKRPILLTLMASLHALARWKSS